MKQTNKDLFAEVYDEELFHSFWQIRVGRLSEELLEIPADKMELAVKTNVDWQLLQQQALGPTLLERLWRFLRGASHFQLMVLLVFVFIFCVAFLVYFFSWYLFFIDSANPADRVVGHAILLWILGMSSILIGVPAYAVVSRIFRPVSRKLKGSHSSQDRD